MAFADADFSASLSLALDTVCDELYAYWRLEESGTVDRVDVRGKNDVTPSASLPNEAGVIGNQANFQGTQILNGATSDPELINFDGSQDFSIVLWCHHDSANQDDGLVSKYDEDVSKIQYGVTSRGTVNRHRFIVSSNGTIAGSSTAQSTVAIVGGQDHFIVADYNSSTGDIRISVDRETPVVVNHGTTIFQNDLVLQLGNIRFLSANQIHDGGLDEVLIYGRILTDDEADALYNGGSGVDVNALLSTCKFFECSVSVDADFESRLTNLEALCDIAVDLRHYYRLEEASGTAFDVRGTGNLTAGNQPGNAAGKVGNARNFVRASSHAIGATDNDLWFMDGNSDFTVTCWASTDDLGAADQAFWGRFDNSANLDRGPLLFFDAQPNDRVRFVMSLDGTSNAINLEPNLGLSVSTLYFLEVTYNATTRLCKLRINRGTGATFEDSDTVAAGTWFKTTINFQIGDGTSPGNLHLDGLVDELTFHDRILTDAELDAMYNGGVGRNINDFLLRKVAIGFESTADFTTSLTVEAATIAASFTADADFTMALAVEGDVNLSVSLTADADFTAVIEVERGLASNFTADADFTQVIELEREIVFAFEALANFQADPLQVFDAFQVAMQVDADFSQDLSVEMDIVLAFAFQADADFVMLLEIEDRLLRSDMDATADFTAVMEVERDLIVDVEALAEFAADLDVNRVEFMALFSGDANFQMGLGVSPGYAFTFTADANFVMALFTADQDALVNDLLGITNQLESNPRLKISGIGANLDPTVLDTQWQIESVQDDTFVEYLSVDPGVTVFAETTGAAPAPFPITTHHAFFTTFTGVGNDWFDKLFVIPPSIAAGFVITEQNIPMTIYSSFKVATRSLDSTVNNVDAGVSLGGGFPTLPEPIPPQSGFAFTMVISPEGPPIIDGTFDFVFDIQTIAVTVTGDRTILFALQPESNQAFVERLTFLTDVIRRRDEREQRISLRKTPRQVFEMEFKLDGLPRQVLESQIFDRQEKEFGIPVWFEPTNLTSPITAGDTVINVEDTSLSDFRDGGLFAVWEDDTVFEVLQISSQTATTITSIGQYQSDHPVTAKVYPVRLGFMNETIDGRKNPRAVQETRLVIRVLDNDSDLSSVAAFPTFNGKVLLDESNMVRGGTLDESWAKNLQVIDSMTGTFRVFSNTELSRRGTRKTFFCDSRQRLWNVRQLLHALRGRQVTFYLPTFYPEFTPTVALTSGDDTLTFENFGYDQFVGARAPRDVIRVVLKDGTTLIRTVISNIVLSVDEERIQVDSAWGVDKSVDEIDFVDYVTLVRMDSDEVTITHGKSIGEAIVTVPVIEVTG